MGRIVGLGKIGGGVWGKGEGLLDGIWERLGGFREGRAVRGEGW